MKKHKIISLIVAFLVAVVLWAYTVNNISPESTKRYYNIPVHFTAENVLQSNGLVLVEGRSQTVTLKIRGNRSDLAKLNSENIKITASLGSITEEGDSEISYTITYPDTVAGGDLAVEERSKKTLKVKTATADTKTMSISVNATGELPEGYLLEEAKTETEFVSVFGPADEVGKISKVQIDVDVSGMTTSQTLQCPFKFIDTEGKELILSSLCRVDIKRSADETADEDTVPVRLDILYYRDLDLKAVVENIPEGYEILSMKFTPLTARVTGKKEDIDALKDTLEVIADLSEAERDGTILTLVCPLNPPKPGVNLYEENNTATLTIVIKQTANEPPTVENDTE